MNNENWNNSEHTHEMDPWDRDTYQTGSTTPPKSHGGAIAVMMVFGILICGALSLLTVMRINIFQLKHPEPSIETSPLSIHVPSTTVGQIDPSIQNDPVQTNTTEPSVDGLTEIPISTSPAGVENIPMEGGLSLQEIYARNIDSVVSISCTLPYGRVTGTGVVLSADGYVITNAHVVAEAVSVQVILTSGVTLEARLVGTDTVTDLAVLKVDYDYLTPAELGDSDSLRVGDLVVAIGDPLGIALHGTMTDGIISGINRDIPMEGRTMTLIQTNAALNEGNSGGPLINCYGQVIGINTMKIGDSMSAAGVEGLGFAIPSTTVREIATQLITQGYVSGRPDLGMEGKTVSTRYQLYYGLPSGMLITKIDENCDAYTKGIRADDVIMALSGQRIYSIEDYEAMVNSFQVGDQVTLVIYRDGRQYELQLTVGEAGA